MFSYALVAQGIEQWFPVPCVGGSNPFECIMKGRVYKNMKLNWENAREFVIKNLRYILVVILLIVLVVVLVQCSSKDKEKSAKKAEEESVEVIPVEEPEEAEAESDELQVNAYENVNALVSQYFTALQTGDIESYKKICNDLSAEDQVRITKKSEFIESYQNIVCYSKKGPIDNSYIVFAYYEIKFKDVASVAPGLKSLYICTDDSGALYINDAELDAEVEAYINQLAAEDDVKQLIETVNAKYNEVVSADQQLRVFITNLTDVLDQAVAAANQAAAATATDPNAAAATTDPNAAATAVDPNAAAATTDPNAAAAQQAAAQPAGQAVNETVMLIDTANVRSDANETATKLGTAYMGESYTRTAVLDSGWSKISYNNQDGYIKSEFLTTDPTQVAASTNETVTVKETVNVRKSADEGAGRLGVAYQGETYTRTMDYGNGWSEIDFKGTKGYVKSDYLQ